MRAVVIYVALIAWVPKLFALDANPDEEGEGMVEVIPWALRGGLSGSGFLSGSSDGLAYQAVVDQSFTLQANRTIWINGGIRSIESTLPTFSQPLRELGTVSLSVAIQAYSDNLYVLASGRFPLHSGSLPPSDSVALSDAVNGYLPFNEGGLFSGPSGLLGLLMKFPLLSGETLFGLDFFRPGTVEPLQGLAPQDSLRFLPASYYRISIEHLWTKVASHALKANFVYFLNEETSQQIRAHQEGIMFLGEYSAYGLGLRDAWDIEGGIRWKGIDRNRRLRLKVDLPLAKSNDNIQKAWLGFRWKPWAQRLIWMGLQGQGLLEVGEKEIGYECRWEVGMPWLVQDKHWLELKMDGLQASFQDVSYWGGGMSLSFALKHLGVTKDSKEAKNP